VKEAPYNGAFYSNLILKLQVPHTVFQKGGQYKMRDAYTPLVKAFGFNPSLYREQRDQEYRSRLILSSRNILKNCHPYHLHFLLIGSSKDARQGFITASP